ncbi:uncharacterized protein LOC128962252 isoform X2 [Oppia nitens]|uniref:uncharacterized protein LOC128962252 isoform X2 n=1 Tax=Oppia nitens TaxID=1686743 RepID=UPI0023DB46C8|nr:uncharacterized protein LOC128962252 isoform X2 [Oppia nitens]
MDSIGWSSIDVLLMTITAIIAISFISIIYLFIKFRRRPELCPVKCHYCHESQEVLFSETNSFDCRYCRQYNGFKPDGSYNKLIPDHYMATENPPQFCRPILNCYSNSGQLCHSCNINQEIKIKLLTEFMPFNENKFTEEYEEYKRHLENGYRLCSQCESTLKNILSKPINCIKTVVNHIVQQNLKPDLDLVFAKQSNKHMKTLKTSLIVIQVVLEVISITCSLIMNVFAINDFNDNSDLSIVEFPAQVNQFLYLNLSNQSLVIFCGLISSLTSLAICDKQLIPTALWLAFVSIDTQFISNYFDKISTILLRTILSAFLITVFTITIVSRLICFCYMFYVKYKQNFIKQTEIVKSFGNTVNSKPKVLTNSKVVNRSQEIDNKKPMLRSAEQSIGEQIKSLSIIDERNNSLNSNPKSKQNYWISGTNTANTYGSDLHQMSRNSSLTPKNIILPAKFHYESIAQTSWVSPFKPNQSPRKEFSSNYSYMGSDSQHLINWMTNDISGLVTPPPSISPSICSESAFVNRFSTNVGNSYQLNAFDFKNNGFSNNFNESIVRNRITSKHIVRPLTIDGSSRSSREDSYSNVSQMNDSLSSLSINRRQHLKPVETVVNNETTLQRVVHSLTQSLIIALFVLILFCFVIFLSLPVTFRTQFDFNSMNFQLSVENVPQYDVCIK